MPTPKTTVPVITDTPLSPLDIAKAAEDLALALQDRLDRADLARVDQLSELVCGLRQDLTDLAARPVVHEKAAESLTGEQVEHIATTRVAAIAEQWQAWATRTDARLSAQENNATSRLMAEVVAAAVPGVYGKVLALMREVGAIGKDQVTDSGPKYAFRGIDTVMARVHAGMTSVGLVVFPTILDKTYTTNTARNASGTEILYTTCSLTVRYTFVDPADGSTVAFEMVGEGKDNSDKATSKAASMALKYGLLETLMVPTADLDDSDRDSPQVVQEHQAAAAPPARTPEEQQARAMDALVALRAATSAERVDEIGRSVAAEGLTDFPVQGLPLRGHAMAIRATLTAVGGTAQGDHHPDSMPPESDQF